MLLNNYSVLNSNPGREIGGGGINNLFNYCKASTWRNFYIGDHVVLGQTNKASFPTGTQNPNSIVTGFKGGEISATTMVSQSSSIVVNLTQGVNIATTDIVGTGDLVSPSLSLIVQLACSILGGNTLSANMKSKVELAVSLAGSGDLTASLSLLAGLVAGVLGSSTLTSNAFGTADLSATITNSSTLSPESLAAAVWNSVAAAFNTAGTMGNKLNSAASAGDPWGTTLPGSYVSGEAGNILAQIQTLVDELHKIQGLDPLTPSTTTQTTWDAGGIHIDISGDGVNTTTMTRS